MTDIQRDEIARLIREGYSEGRIDSDGEYIAWKLSTEVWKDDEEIVD